MPMVRILEIDDNASANRTAPAALQKAVGRPHRHRFSLRRFRVCPDCREHRVLYQNLCSQTNFSTVLSFPFPVHLSAGACLTMQGLSSDPRSSADGGSQRKLRLA